MPTRYTIGPTPSWTGYGVGTAPALADAPTIVEVTNLNDSGAGSLRSALDTNPTTARIIKFTVAGTIELETKLNINTTKAKNFWVMGETAPSPGITIANFGIDGDDNDNCRFSHLRFHTGTKYAGGIFNDWTLISDTKYKTQNYQLAQFGSNSQVSKLTYPIGTTLTLASDDTLSDGDWFFDHTANGGGGEIYVDVGEDPATEGGVLVGFAKAHMPDPLTFNDTNGIEILNCTFRYGTDIAMSVDNCTNVTVANCLFADALDWPFGGDRGRHSKALLFKLDGSDTENDNIMVMRNVFTHCADRNPFIKWGQAIVANNVVYDAQHGTVIDATRGDIKVSAVSLIGNYYFPVVTDYHPNMEVIEIYCNDEDPNGRGVVGAPADPHPAGGTVYFGPDNYWDGALRTDPWNSDAGTKMTEGEWIGYTGGDYDVKSGQRLSAPHDDPGAQYLGAEECLAWFNIWGGARPWDRDAADIATLAELDGTPSTLTDIKEDYRTDIPYIVRAGTAINAAGTQLTITWSEAVTHGAGGTGGVKLNDDTSDNTCTYASGAGTTALVYSLGSSVLSGQEWWLYYDNGGDGGASPRIVADDDAAQALGVWRWTVKNNSTRGGIGTDDIGGAFRVD